MPSLLFVPSTPLSFCKRKVRTISTRRPRPTHCSSNPNPSSDPSDSSWKDIARSLGSSDATPPRPPPTWKQLDDSPSTTDSSVWATWNSARGQETPLTPRDPKQETDFWRSTAREINENPLSSADKPLPEDTSSTEVWGMAREITGEISELESKLKADLEKYNPEENTDQYRKVARELTGPQEEDWEMEEGGGGFKRSEMKMEGEASAASGWNPDTDWKRFDDIRREEELKMQKQARKDVAKDAQQKKQAAYDKLSSGEQIQGVDDVTYTDDAGRVLTPDEVKKAMEGGAVFVDEAGEEINSERKQGVEANPGQVPGGVDKYDSATNAFESGKVPGFIANRFRSNGTYGSGCSGAEDYVRELQEKGIPLRDPKADALAWREAARELNIEVESDAVDLSTSGEEDEDSSKESSVEDSVVKEISAPDESHDSLFENSEPIDNSEEPSLWSSWRRGNTKWEKAVEKAAPRDPKQEVDVWRSSARELINDVQEIDSTDSGSSDSKNEAPNTESTAWNAWRNANSKWESSLEEADGNLSQYDVNNPWSSQGVNTDWGAGLNAKTSSDRSAWENWNKVKNTTAGLGKQNWWPKQANEDSKGKNNIDQWRETASEAISSLNLDSPSKKSIADAGNGAREQDDTLNFWKDIARDMSPNEKGDE